MEGIIGDDIICSVRGAVQHIVQLAADPDAQESLMAMDGLLDNLLMYMQMEEEDIRLAAAHAIEFLSTNIKIKKELADNDALIKIMNSMYWSEDERGKKIAGGFFHNIHKYMNPSIAQSLNHDVCSMDIYSVERTENKFYTFEMMGLSDPDFCYELQSAIIGITGVVSITFDKVHDRITVNIRELKGKSSKLLIKNAIANVLSNRVEEIPTDNECDIDYIDELMDYESSEKEAIATYGFSSIESRLEAKRQEQERKEKEKKKTHWLLGKVTSVLSSWWSFVCLNKELLVFR